ncbi:MAG: DHH family phosphoesterase [Candidatus Woesearchaeota archaeon]
MSSQYDHFLHLVKDKRVVIATHWDCDGVTSGALLYHMIKDVCQSVRTVSKGDVFEIRQQDIDEIDPAAQIIICSDIQPSRELDLDTVIYIDHHPCEYADEMLLSLYDPQCQSCSFLIWDKLLKDTTDSYMIFLVLLGYFGDSGKFEQLPVDLQIRAHELLGSLLEKKQSRYSNDAYYKIELFVSLFNTGKRMHWNGEVPLALLKSVQSFEDIIYSRHPLVEELQRYKMHLRQHYNKKYRISQLGDIDYAIIECDCNIQGVICSRYMKEKPIVVLNKYKGNIIASMRVPEELEFDAGGFLSAVKEHIPDVVGGGHEKAGGITFEQKYLDVFLEYLENGARQPS